MHTPTSTPGASQRRGRSASLSPRRAPVVCLHVSRSHPCPEPQLAADRARRIHPPAGSHRKRQNPRRLSLVPQPSHVLSASAPAGALPRPLHLAAQGAGGRCRAQPAHSAGRHRRKLAAQRGDSFHRPTLFVRTGDTPSAERGRFQRQPADILITTPESLYLLLTSNARQAAALGRNRHRR